jgi:4-hydroxy-3-methylbut-2-en-1-yl diphosphate reductase
MLHNTASSVFESDEQALVSGATAAPVVQVLLSQPRGFCAGVVRAIEIADRALQLHGAPIFIFHEIVHNGHVVADLRARGVVFVNELSEVPSGAVTIFSAHGVSLAVVREAQLRGLNVIDATCPLVSKVHQQAQRYSRSGHTLIVIGHAGHEEIEGTLGRVNTPVHLVSNQADVTGLDLPADTLLAYVTQTTLSVDDTRDIIAALTERFPLIKGPSTDDICYATQNRQNAVRELATKVELILVVGSRNSSNAARLREVALQQGVAAYLVQDETEINPHWLTSLQRIGVTAGASTPEVLVQRVAHRLSQLSAANILQADVLDPRLEEGIVFRLPVALLRRAA